MLPISQPCCLFLRCEHIEKVPAKVVNIGGTIASIGQVMDPGDEMSQWNGLTSRISEFNGYQLTSVRFNFRKAAQNKWQPSPLVAPVVKKITGAPTVTRKISVFLSNP